MPYPRLATLRDVGSFGIPAQALTSKTIADKRRAICAASELFTARLRKRYSPPLSFELSDLEVASAEGTATTIGSPTNKDAVDVKVEITVGGTIDTGTGPGGSFLANGIQYRVSKEDGTAGTWGPTLLLAGPGTIEVDGVTLTLVGTFADLDTVTYTVGPSPAVRASVGAWAAWIMVNSRGANAATLDLIKGPFEEAKSFAKELAKGEEAELDQKSDATPDRAEGGPTWTQHTRNGFLFGQP